MQMMFGMNDFSIWKLRLLQTIQLERK